MSATVVRITKPWVWRTGGAEVGQILPHEGEDRFTGWPLVTLPSGALYPVPPDCCEVIPAHLADRHVVTEKEAPDLDDLVRLIEFLRANNLTVGIGWPALATKLAVSIWSHRTDDTERRSRYRWLVTEGKPAKFHSVGKDGTVYDVEGVAL